MDSNILIKVKNLNKEFKILRSNNLSEDLSTKNRLVLQDINFSVKQGEYIGVIGLNGAGKTTLLRILANIIQPSSGQVYVKGKTTAFIEWGVGFNDDLSVKKNIIFYGLLMGMEYIQIKKKIDEILDFSGLKEFKNFEFRTLSQGMKVRLALSTVIFVGSDIFLMDEALAVGDKEFANKCYDKFLHFKKIKKTLILVSHNSELINWVCDKTLLLDRGQQIMFDKTDKVIDYYKKHIKWRE